MSKQTNDALFLFSMALNHSSTERVLLHRFTLAAKAVFFTMLWSTYFATFPISDLAGLISRHVGELLKFGLWSFKVMKASRLAMVSILSANSNLSVRDRFCLLIDLRFLALLGFLVSLMCVLV